MSKRKLTPEQEAKRDERRAYFKGICQKIHAMTPDERAALGARMAGRVRTVEGRELSFHNQLLIALQRPGCTIVGGFRQWLGMGRCVQKGEHGIMIWVPCGARKADGAPDETPGPDACENERRFITGTLFDISQTAEVETKGAQQIGLPLEQVAA